MSDAAQRRRLVEIGRLLYERRYLVATEGNLSVRIAADRFLTTPAGACKGWLAPDDLLEVGSAGDVRAGRGRPTSEWLLHREIYALRSDAAAVCHAHPPCATACAAAGRPLDGRVLTESAWLLGDVPVAPPAAPGTAEVVRSLHGLVAGADAVLLANHGVVTFGADLDEAYFRLEAVERLAEVTLLAALAGGARPLRRGLARAAALARQRRSVGRGGDEPDADHRREHEDE